MEMKWISIKDKLPDKEEMVLVATSGSSFVYDVFWSPKHKLFNATDSTTRKEAEKYAFDDVTHWMPLPKHPKFIKED